MLKKILLTLLFAIILLIGGTYFFLQYKKDFILEKVSSLVEEATGAPLIMSEFPSLAFSPTPCVALGAASWGTNEFAVKFQSARVHFSFSELLDGNFALSSIALDGLHLKYDETLSTTESTTNNEVTSETNAESENESASSSVEESIDDAFIFMPENIELTNSTIDFKDATQTLLLSNLNLEINNLILKEKTSVSFKTTIKQAIIEESTTENYEYDFETDLSFVLNGANLDFNINNLSIIPKNGLGFTETITAKMQTALTLEPLTVRSLNAELNSPFMTTEMTQTGEMSADSFAANVNTTIFPRLITQTFAPDTDLPSTNDLDKITFTTGISYNNNIFSLQDFQSTVGTASIKTTLVYDQNADTITGNFDLSGCNLNTFLDNTSTASTNSIETDTPKTTSQPNTATNTKIELPSELQKTTFDIDITLNDISYDNIIINSLSTTLQGKNSAFTMNPLNITTMGSDIAANIALDLGAAQSMAITTSIPSLDINTWNKALTGNTALSGTATVNTSLTFPIADPISNLNGSGQIDLATVKIQSTLIPTISKILVAAAITDNSFEFADGKIPFTLAKSVLTLNKAYLNSSKYYVTASGTTNLITEELNIEAEAGKGENSSTTIPATITGTMSDPKVKVNLLETAKAVTQILDSALQTDISSKLNLDDASITEKLNETITDKIPSGIGSSLTNLLGK